MHPQAILIDSTTDEEDFFLLGVRDEVRGTNSALIELPERPGESLAWVTKLDSASLSGKKRSMPRNVSRLIQCQRASLTHLQFGTRYMSTS
jgi:hypothetical protein